MRKFTAYSMNRDDPANEGKWEAWAALGYDIGHHREETAADVTRQLRRRLPDAETYGEVTNPHGPRCRTDTVVIGPNGRRGTLVVVWQYNPGQHQACNGHPLAAGARIGEAAVNEGDRVRLRTDVTGDVGGKVIPTGTVGVVVDVYTDPNAYAVDVTVDGEPDNVYVTAEQVEPATA